MEMEREAAEAHLGDDDARTVGSQASCREARKRTITRRIDLQARKTNRLMGGYLHNTHVGWAAPNSKWANLRPKVSLGTLITYFESLSTSTTHHRKFEDRKLHFTPLTIAANPSE